MRLLLILLIASATIIGEAALTLPTDNAVYAQTGAPGSPTGIAIRPASRGYSDRWPLMFTWTRNKVNWWNLTWRSIELPSSTLYFYQEAEPVARMARILVAESDSTFEATFDYNLQTYTASKTIPKIIYTSHHTFEQTNTIAEYVPEGVAGFTEFTKGRVVFPYTGSNSDFLHVLVHENAHIHMIHKLKHVFKANGINDSSKLLPTIWFAEGLAEYESKGKDAETGRHRMDHETEMYMRDAVINDRFPTIREMRLYPDWERVYKYGHALVQYMGAQYGEDRIHDLLSNWHHIFRNRNSFNWLRRRPLDSFDPLNPGVEYHDPPFIWAGENEIPVSVRDGRWMAHSTSGLVDSLEGSAVGDLVSLSENIQLDDQWYRIIYTSGGNPAFYNPDHGQVLNWEGRGAASVIRRKKEAFEKSAYNLMSFEKLVEWWYDIELKQLSEEWHEATKAYYQPWLAERASVKDMVTVSQGAPELWPTVSRDGKLVFYKALQDDYAFTILVMDLETGNTIELATENTPETESIHILIEGGDLWLIGDSMYRAVYTAQYRDRDIIYFQDLVRGEDGSLELIGSRKTGFDPITSDIVAISGVRFTSDHDRIVFSGMGLNGLQDIFLADLTEGRIERRLTEDLASDRMPVMWNDHIVFASDRSSPSTTFAYHLFSYDLETGQIYQLTDSAGDELNPQLSSDGSRLFFQSNASGVSNIYEWTEDEDPIQLTDVTTGVFTPSIAGPDTILVSGFYNGEYRLNLIPIAPATDLSGATPDLEQRIGAYFVAEKTLTCMRVLWDAESISAADQLASIPMESIPYRPSFSLDDFYASSEFGGSRSYNTSVFGSEIRFSDILGNYMVGAAVWNGPRRGLDDLSWVLTYWNQHNRMKLGGSVFKTSGIYFNLARQDFYIRERAGFNFQFNFPFNQFSDLDLFLGIATERRRLGTVDGSIKFRQLEVGIGYTRDVASWGPAGPHRGWVFSAFFDQIFDASDRFSTFTRYLVADIRGYFPLHRYVVAAGRAAWGSSTGTEPEFFFLGGGFFLRGYWNLYSLYGSSYELVNTELRMQPLEILGMKAPKMFAQRGWPIQFVLYAEGARTEWNGGRLGPLGSAGVSLRLTLALPFLIEYAWYKRNFWERDGQRDQGVVVTLLF